MPVRESMTVKSLWIISLHECDHKRNAAMIDSELSLRQSILFHTRGYGVSPTPLEWPCPAACC